MGSAASSPAAAPATEPSTRQAASRLDRPRTTSRSLISYFLPITTRDLTHDHLPPFPDDILDIVAELQSPPHLPNLHPEILYQILDMAEIWPACRRTSRRPVTLVAGAVSPRVSAVPGPQLVMQWLGGQEEEVREEREALANRQEDGLKEREGEVWYLVSSPIGCIEPSAHDNQASDDESSSGRSSPEHVKEEVGEDTATSKPAWTGRLRRVVVDTLSKDQGWSSFAEYYGTYEQSYSWFELSLLRDGKQVPDSRTAIQYNVHAGQYYKAHKNVLEGDHPFVSMAKPGDRIVLWARAQYPGWRNYVKEAAITVYTAPYL